MPQMLCELFNLRNTKMISLSLSSRMLIFFCLSRILKQKIIFVNIAVQAFSYKLFLSTRSNCHYCLCHQNHRGHSLSTVSHFTNSVLFNPYSRNRYLDIFSHFTNGVSFIILLDYLILGPVRF